MMAAEFSRRNFTAAWQDLSLNGLYLSVVKEVFVKGKEPNTLFDVINTEIRGRKYNQPLTMNFVDCTQSIQYHLT